MISFEDLSAMAAAFFGDVRPFIPMYIHLILSALFPIYTGAHASLSRPSSAAKPTKVDKEKDEDEEEDTVQKMEGLSNKDAIMLPITAGLVLAGLYFLIMRYGADMINLFMGIYFSAVGVYSVSQLINDGLKLILSFVCPGYYAYNGSLWKVSAGKHEAIQQDDKKETIEMALPPFLRVLPLPRSWKMTLWSSCRTAKQKYTLKAYVKSVLDLRAQVIPVSALSACVGVGTIIYVNAVAKPWFLTNLQGFAMSYSALQLMSPTSFATGSLILGALFCYDIWAVFFTPLMVTVAKNLDQPMKLVFPRPDEPSATPGEPPTKSFSMLGLGDIVLPGIMIGLALRFDLHLFYLKKQKRSQSVGESADNATSEGEVEKAPYISPTGRWGDCFWTRSLPKASLPAQLRSSFPKPYFTSTMIGYVVGMLTTLGVMSVFQHAQPALLYLVPGVLISLWGTALARGELKEAWEFTEAVTAEQVDEDNESKEHVSAEKEEQHKGLFARLWQAIWMGEVEEEKKKNEKKATSDHKADEHSSTKEVAPERKVHETKSIEEGLVLSFSLTRSKPETKLSSEDSFIANEPAVENTTTRKASNSTKQTAVPPIDQSAESPEPRYRTRSVRSG